MRRYGLPLLFGSLLLSHGSAAPPSRADEAETQATKIYKWVDENGVPHYTADPDRIPESLRDRIRRLRGGEHGGEATSPRAHEERWAERDVPPQVETAEPVGRPPFGSVDVAAGPPALSEREALDREIAAVEAQIAAQEETMKALISEVGAPGSVDLPNDPQFRSTARLLPELQAQLRVLREKRAHLEGAAPGPRDPTDDRLEDASATP